MRFSSKISSLALVVAAIAASFGAQAQSIDVRVTGTVTPAACIPSLAGGGVVDYGNIQASTLNATSPNVLGAKEVPFTITCDAPTRVAVRATDNRASSVVPGLANVLRPGLGDASAYGLGTVRGKNVGAFTMQFNRVGGSGIDGQDVAQTHSANNGLTWANGAGMITPGTERLLSFRYLTGSVIPVAFSTMSAGLLINTAVDRTSNLDLTDDISLDGLATLELVYL